MLGRTVILILWTTWGRDYLVGDSSRMEALRDISGLQKDCGIPTRDLGVFINKKKNENCDSRILVLVQGASVCLTVSYCSLLRKEALLRNTGRRGPRNVTG